MGSLVFLGLWGLLFTQVHKLQLPILWSLGISFVAGWWIFIEVSTGLDGLWVALHDPRTSTLLLVGLLSLGVCAGSIIYLRNYYARMKDPFKHLR